MKGRIEHDPLFLLAALALGFCSLLFLASTSAEGGTPYFVKQCLWLVVGACAFWIATRIDYGFWTEFSNLLYVGLLVMLLWLLFFGRTVANTRAWIDLGPLNLQPSELAKPILALMVARYCGDAEANRFTLRDFLVPLVYVSIPLALVAAQGDMGTAVTFLPILATAWILGGIKPRTLAAVGVTAALFTPLLWMGVLKPYQKERILIAVTNPLSDPQGAGYQVIQSRIAVGSGGVLGTGLFSGTQSRLDFLPAHHTDFIFSVVAEETGFVGSIVVLSLYLLLLHRILTAAILARDRQGTFLAVSIMAVFGLHLVLNLGMVLGLLPTVGIPLPLLSYGGSSMLATSFALGLAYNVRMRRFQEAH